MPGRSTCEAFAIVRWRGRNQNWQYLLGRTEFGIRNLKTKPPRGAEKIFWLQPLLKTFLSVEKTWLHGHVSQHWRCIFRPPNHLLDFVVGILRPFSTVFRLVSKKNMFLSCYEQFLTFFEVGLHFLKVGLIDGWLSAVEGLCKFKIEFVLVSVRFSFDLVRVLEISISWSLSSAVLPKFC